MIREIRTISPSDQNRLRDEHKHEGSDDAFSRYLQSRTQDDVGETITSATDIQTRVELNVSKSVPRNKALWGSFFTQLGEGATNDQHETDPLFSWGETRENAKRHTALARKSAKFNSLEITHALNEKI